MPYVGIFVIHFIYTLYILCIEAKRNCVNHNKGKITLKIFPMGQNEFSYELTFISIEKSDKQKSKNTLRLEIDLFGDG